MFAAFQISEIIQIFVIQNYYSSRAYYNIAQVVIFSTMLFLWLVYGNIIFFSDSNDCTEKEEFKMPVFFMRLSLILGYAFMVYYLCLLFVIMIVLVLVYRERTNRRMPVEEIHYIRQSLISLEFDPLVHRLEKECVICCLEFKERDMVTQLKCHEKHIFHTQCLDEWVK